MTVRRGILATDDQLDLERVALDALASPGLDEALATVREMYAADHVAATTSGAATAEDAVLSIAHATVQLALADQDEARFQWVVNAAHTWRGLDVPAPATASTTPTTSIATPASTRTAATGSRSVRRRGAPRQQSVILYAEPPGLGAVTREGAEIVDVLVRTPESGDEDEITVGRGAGGPLHLDTQGRARFVLVRDALGNWSAHLPSQVAIERLDADRPADLPALGDVVTRAAQMLPTLARFWLDYDNTYLWSRPANALVPPRVRPFGAAASTTFQLAPDTALLLTVRRHAAAYLGCEVTDPWGVARPYVDRTGSLNAAQAFVSADDTVSFVVAAHDPGAHNWLDTQGLDSGLLTVRWQGFPGAAPDAEDAVVRCELVALSDLTDLLPDQPFLDEADRRRQLDERAATYARRFA